MTICLQARNTMSELHELQEEKLLLSQIKSKNVVEKTYRKSVKRSSKRGESTDVLSAKNQAEMTKLVTEQEERVRSNKN